jgi:ubiquitin-protein ligase
MNTCIKRLKKELIVIEKSPDEFISLQPNPSDIRSWTAVVRAPPDSVYDGFKFEVAIDCANDYPLTPPKMKFITRIFHPNVYFEVCANKC